MTKWRKVAAGMAGIGATTAVVLDAISRLQLAQQILPKEAGSYLPLVYLGGFIVALLLLRHTDSPVDGVLYRENVRHRQQIEELTARNTALEAVVARIPPPRQLTDNDCAKLRSALQPCVDELVSVYGYAHGFLVRIWAIGGGDSETFARQI